MLLFETWVQIIIAEMSETADKTPSPGLLAQEFSHYVTLSNYITWVCSCQQFFHGFSMFFCRFFPCESKIFFLKWISLEFLLSLCYHRKDVYKLKIKKRLIGELL